MTRMEPFRSRKTKGKGEVLVQVSTGLLLLLPSDSPPLLESTSEPTSLHRDRQQQPLESTSALLLFLLARLSEQQLNPGARVQVQQLR